MKERLKLKTDLRDNLKMDIRELNDKLVGQNTMIRSQLENEKLRGEIRDLTNEKARLEMKFNQRKYYLKFYINWPMINIKIVSYW